jgi:UDP-galactopyranose mutase
MLVKRSQRVFLFVALQVFLILFHVRHYSKVVQLSYQNQKLERDRHVLVSQRNDLLQCKHRKMSHDVIKKFAQKQWGMASINLTQITSLEA